MSAADAGWADEAPSPRKGRLVTPLRVLLVVVWVGAALTAAYGLLIAKSLPMAVSGLGVLTVAFFLLGVLAAGATIRAGRRGAAGLAFGSALFGGLCMLGASGSLTLAIVLGLLVSPT